MTPVSLSRLLDKFIEEKLVLQSASNQNISLSWEEKQEYLAKLSIELKSEGSNISVEEMDTEILFDRSRIERVAKGSGTTAKDVRELLKHWKQSTKMMKKMGGKPEKLMKKFKLPT